MLLHIRALRLLLFNVWIRTVAVEAGSQAATRVVRRVITRWPRLNAASTLITKSTTLHKHPKSKWLGRFKALNIPVQGVVVATMAQMCANEYFRIEDILVYDINDPLPQGVRIRSDGSIFDAEPEIERLATSTTPSGSSNHRTTQSLQVPCLPYRRSHCCACTHFGQHWCTDHATRIRTTNGKPRTNTSQVLWPHRPPPYLHTMHKDIRLEQIARQARLDRQKLLASARHVRWGNMEVLRKLGQ